jgi:uncharacterized protein (TIGR02453 family)
VAGFFSDLDENNNREWWKANSSRFDQEVKQPIQLLVNSLKPEFGSIKVFRPFRDVRFSADKRPYNAHASFAAEGTGGMLYFQIGANEVRIAGGRWQPSPAELGKFREVISDVRLIGDLREQLAERENDGLRADDEAVLKTAPRGYSIDDPNIDLLRRTKLSLMRVESVNSWLSSSSPLETVTATWRSVELWNAWLQENISPYVNMAESKKSRSR